MTLTVTFYTLGGPGKNAYAGKLTWDGTALAADPADSPLLAGILADPIPEPVTGRALDPGADPEAWLRNLRFTYRSAYLRAGEVAEG